MDNEQLLARMDALEQTVAELVAEREDRRAQAAAEAAAWDVVCQPDRRD